MIREVNDPNSGAILFKREKDKELEKVKMEVEALKVQVKTLEALVIQLIDRKEDLG